MNILRFQQPTYPVNASHLINQLLNEQLNAKNKPAPSFSPLVNIKEDEDAFEIEFSVPGYQRDQLTVKNEKNTLIVKSTFETEKEIYNFKHKEFSIYPFERSFKMPENIAADKIGAKLENGILQIIIPKKKEEDKTEEYSIAIS